MKRYLKGVIQGLESNAIPYQVIRPSGTGALSKYLQYPRLAWAKRKQKGKHLIISERYAYLTWFLKKNTIVVCHDLHTLYPQAKVAWVHKWIYRFFLRSMLLAEKVVCVSKCTERALVHYFPRFGQHKKVKTVHNGIEPFWVNDSIGDEEPPSWAHLFRENDVLLSVGTDAWYKNNSWSIRLLADLSKRFHLIRVGNFDADNEALIEALGLQGRITLLSNISDQQLKYAYQKSKALLFPSVSEGFGWPAIEAALSGCPVVANYQEPLSEIFEGEDTIVSTEHARVKLEANELPLAKPSVYLWKEQVIDLIG